jgi:hypothetical protein
MDTSRQFTSVLLSGLLVSACHQEPINARTAARGAPTNRVEGAVLGVSDWQEHLAWCPAVDSAAESGAPSVSREDVIGDWYPDQAVPNTGGEWYAFLPDSSYVDMPDVVDCRDRIVARRGTWHYQNGGVEVTPRDTVKLRGGRIELDGVDVASTITNGTPARIVSMTPRRFRLKFVVTRNEEDGAGNRMSLRRFDGLKLWKYSSNSDPDHAARYDTWSPAVRLPVTADLESDCEPPPEQSQSPPN